MLALELGLGRAAAVTFLLFAELSVDALRTFYSLVASISAGLFEVFDVVVGALFAVLWLKIGGSVVAEPVAVLRAFEVKAAHITGQSRT